MTGPRARRYTANTVRDLYAQLGMGQREAARRVGVNEDHFRQMCRGTRPVTASVIDGLYRLLNKGSLR